MNRTPPTPTTHPWNKGMLVGQKLPLKLEHVWAIRIRLELEKRVRDLALFNLAIDSKLRGCDLVRLRVRDVSDGKKSKSRAQVLQKKTKMPVKFEITSRTRSSISNWVEKQCLEPSSFLFPSRSCPQTHISTRQYCNLAKRWIAAIGLDSRLYGTHSLRRTKVAQIYKLTKNLRAIQLLLGHTSLESTVRYLGVELDDAISLSEKIEI